MAAKVFFSALLCILTTVETLAQTSVTDNRASSHVFAALADGRFSDSSGYRSTLMVQTDNVAANCTWRFYGITLSGIGDGTTRTISLSPDDWYIGKSAGTGNFKSGYATLTCSAPVIAQILYTYFSPSGNVISEATVFSSPPASYAQLLADQTGGAQLGIAIANNSDTPKSFQLSAYDANNNKVGEAAVQIAARSQISRFLNELLPSVPSGFAGQVIVYSNSSDINDVFAIGLKYTGTAFTTIPVTVRDFTQPTPQATYTISISASPAAGGSVTGGGTFTANASRTVTATASSGYTFTNWTENGAVVSTNSSYTFTLTSNRTLVANFTAAPLATYTISISASPAAGGSVSGGGTFTANTSRTVTATANSGYTFTNWTENGAVVSTSSSYTFTLTSNRTLVANFTAIPVTYRIFLSKNPTYAGGVSGEGVFPANTSRTVTATAYSGSFESYTFTNWTENGRVVSTNSSYTFTLTSDRDLVANFTATTPVLFSEDFSGGTIDSSRWFVSTEPVSVSSDVGNPPPALKWVWPNRNATSSAGVGVHTVQTFDASTGGGIEVSFDLVTPYDPTGRTLSRPRFTVGLWGANGHLIYLSSDYQVQISCGGSLRPFAAYTDGSVHHYTITISSLGVVTWKRDGSILVDRSVSGCQDAASVTVYSLSFGGDVISSSLEMAAWVDNIRITRP